MNERAAGDQEVAVEGTEVDFSANEQSMTARTLEIDVSMMMGGVE